MQIEFILSLIILGITILTLLAGFGWYVRNEQDSKLKLINAILAKDSQDYVNRTLAGNTKITPEVSKADPDLIPMDQVNDDQFDAMIQAQLNNKKADQEIT